MMEFDSTKNNYLYVIRDCISGNLSNIFPASSDLHAYEYHRANLEQAQKNNSGLTLDDFELIFLGVQDKATGLITPDYRLVDESTFEAMREEQRQARNKAIEEIRKTLNIKK